MITRKARELQLVAATATIANPGEHMKRPHRFGLFRYLHHEDDGAPQSEQIVTHLACPDGNAIKVVKELHHRVLTAGT